MKVPEKNHNLKKKYLFAQLHRVLVASPGIVPDQGDGTQAPCIGSAGVEVNHSTTEEVPTVLKRKKKFKHKATFSIGPCPPRPARARDSGLTPLKDSITCQRGGEAKKIGKHRLWEAAASVLGWCPGNPGTPPRVKQWPRLLLPLAVGSLALAVRQFSCRLG